MKLPLLCSVPHSCSQVTGGDRWQRAWGSCVSPGEGLLPSAPPQHPRFPLHSMLHFALCVQSCSFLGEQKLLAFPSKGTWIPPMMEDGGRARHREIPRGLISAPAHAEVLHLPGDQLAPTAVCWGSGRGPRRSSPLGSTLAQWHSPTALLQHFPFSHAPGTRTASCL